MRSRLDRLKKYLSWVYISPLMPDSGRKALAEVYVLLEELVTEVEALKHGKEKG